MSEEAPQEIIKVSIFTPLIYVGIVLTAFVVYSIRYRAKKLVRLAQMDSIFAEDLSRQLYLDLKSASPPVHDKVLKTALMRRGGEAIRRTLKIREISPYLQTLYQQGSIGDDLYKNFEIHSRIQEENLKEIAMEAESLQPGWAPTFFPVVQEVCFNEALRRRLNVLDERGAELNLLWNGALATRA